jgi:hypothetical protein
MTPLEEIRRLYFNATRTTIQRDLARAIDLIRSLPDDEARQKAAVYMEGLAQMRSEWNTGPGRRGKGEGGLKSTRR